MRTGLETGAEDGDQTVVVEHFEPRPTGRHLGINHCRIQVEIKRKAGFKN